MENRYTSEGGSSKIDNWLIRDNNLTKGLILSRFRQGGKGAQGAQGGKSG